MDRLFEALYAAEFDYRFIHEARKNGLIKVYKEEDEVEARDRRDGAREAVQRAVLRAAKDAPKPTSIPYDQKTEV